MRRRTFLSTLAATLAVSGCSRGWTTSYETIDPATARDWRIADVIVTVPDELTTTEANTFAPRADIVWHGEPFGDRKMQVAAIFREAALRGTNGLNGPRPVTMSLTVAEFHAVTPAAVARAPAAVHNIAFQLQIFDAETAEPLTEAQLVEADLDALVGAAAVAAAVEGQTQRVRIVDHLTTVFRGIFGVGPDPRRTFSSIGR